MPARWPKVRPWLLVVLLACRGAEPAAPAAAPTPRLTTSPPSGPIHLVAITDAADAAITADNGGGWRLWPALDGTRPPVIFHASAPRRAALGRDGDGLVAAVLDEAGAIELIRMTRDGVVTGRALLPADPGFESLVALPGGILALGRDRVVAWYGANGALRARAAPLPGEFLVDLAARRGRAIAVIGRTDRAATAVRWLEMDGEALRWGAHTNLPVPLRGVALAPDHRRIAGLRREGTGQVIELGSARIVQDGLGESGERAAIGFMADRRVAMGGLTWVWRSPGGFDVLGDDGVTSFAAFGDGLIAIGSGESLVLADVARVRMLGYREVGVGPVLTAGAHFALSVDRQVLWLDGRLAAARVTEEPEEYPRYALDERLVVELVRQYASQPSRIEIRDTATGALNELGTWDVHGLRFSARGRILAISSGREGLRWVVDTRGAATQLPSLELADAQAFLQPVDPAAARGIVGVAIRSLPQSVAIETFRERGGPHRRMEVGRSLGVDETATIWLARDRTVVALRDGEEVVRVALDLPIEGGTASRDGTFAAVHGENEVIAVDAGGTVRWRREVLRVDHVAISGDARTIAVVTPGGLVALDAATGERRAWACGWHFGLYDQIPASDGAPAQCRPD